MGYRRARGTIHQPAVGRSMRIKSFSPPPPPPRRPAAERASSSPVLERSAGVLPHLSLEQPAPPSALPPPPARHHRHDDGRGLNDCQVDAVPGRIHGGAYLPSWHDAAHSASAASSPSSSRLAPAGARVAPAWGRAPDAPFARAHKRGYDARPASRPSAGTACTETPTHRRPGRRAKRQRRAQCWAAAQPAAPKGLWLRPSPDRLPLRSKHTSVFSCGPL